MWQNSLLAANCFFLFGHIHRKCFKISRSEENRFTWSRIQIFIKRRISQSLPSLEVWWLYQISNAKQLPLTEILFSPNFFEFLLEQFIFIVRIVLFYVMQKTNEVICLNFVTKYKNVDLVCICKLIELLFVRFMNIWKVFLQ